MHLGIGYPGTVLHHVTDWRLGADIRHASFPPRKLVARFTPLGGKGTVADQWEGREVLSDECHLTPTKTDFNRWNFVHPTNSELTITLDWTLRENPGDLPSHQQMRSWVEIKVYQSAVVVGASEKFFPWLDIFSAEYFQMGFETDWTYHPNIAVFDYLFVKIAAAHWNRQPEYAPYRTRP